MKKLLSFAVACALCGFAVACGDDGNPNPGEDIYIPTDMNQGDEGTDVNGQPDVVVNPDADNEVVNPDNGQPDVIVTPDEGTDGTVQPDEGGTDTNLPPCEDGVGSCKWYWDVCAAACPNPQTAEGEACMAECQGQLTAEGQEDLQVFNNCIYNICGSSTTQEAWYACIDENCTEAIIGCYWGCTYRTCAEMYDCFDGCPDDDPGTTDKEDQMCYGDCRNESSEQAQLDQNAMYNCAFDLCPICETYDTQEEEDECNSCFNDALMGDCWDSYKNCASGGTKYETCVDFTICFTTCQYTAQTQAAFNACVDECQSGVTAEGLRDRIIAENCSLDNCTVCQIEEPTAQQDEECNTCWMEAMYGDESGVGVCDAEWSKCAGTDNETCMEYYTCAGGCQDYACVADCRGNTTLAGMKDMIIASECSSTACPVCDVENPTAQQKTECDNCWAGSQKGDCADEWNVCLPHGDDTCAEVFNCIQSCQDNPCAQACYGNGTFDAQDLYAAFEECLQTECASASNFNTCANTAINAGGACADEYTACVPS